MAKGDTRISVSTMMIYLREPYPANFKLACNACGVKLRPRGNRYDGLYPSEVRKLLIYYRAKGRK